MGPAGSLHAVALPYVRFFFVCVSLRTTGSQVCLHPTEELRFLLASEGKSEASSR